MAGFENRKIAQEDVVTILKAMALFPTPACSATKARHLLFVLSPFETPLPQMSPGPVMLMSWMFFAP